MTRYILLLLLTAFALAQSAFAQRIEWTPLPWYYISSFHQADDSTIYGLHYFDWMSMPTTTPLYKSTDLGKTWQSWTPWGVVTQDQTNGRFEGVWTYSVFFQSAAQGWASTSDGLKVTSDSGKTWKNTSIRPLSSSAARILFIQSTDSIVILEYRYSSNFPTALYALNRYSGKIDTLAFREDLQRAKVDGVKSAVILRDTLYIGGYAADSSGSYVAFRALADTTWHSLRIDTSRSNIFLAIHDQRLFAGFNRLLVRLEPAKGFVDTLEHFPAVVKDIEVLRSGEAVVLHETEPYLSVSASSMTKWAAAGVPMFIPGELSSFGSIIYHSGSYPISRGRIVEGGELKLFLKPAKKTLGLKRLGEVDTLPVILANYGDSSIYAELSVESMQNIDFDKPVVELAGQSEVDLAAYIRSINTGRDTARVYATVDGEKHLLAIWYLSVPEPVLETRSPMSIVKVIASQSLDYRIQLFNRGLSALLIKSVRTLDGEFLSDDSTFIAQGKYTSIYFQPATPFPSSGKLVIESNSRLSPDTLEYFIDTTCLTAAHRVDRLAGVRDVQLGGITQINSQVYALSQHYADSLNTVVQVHRYPAIGPEELLVTVDGPKTNGKDEALSIGTSAPTGIRAIVRSELHGGTGGFVVRLDTGGESVETDTIRHEINLARQAGDHLHLRYVHPARSERPYPDRVVRYGKSAEARSNSKSVYLNGRSQYDSRFEYYYGEAWALASGVDSSDQVYIAGIEEVGNGSVYEPNVRYDTVLYSSATSFKSVHLFAPQRLEVTPNGRLATLSGNTVRAYGKNSSFLFDRSGISGVITGNLEDFFLRLPSVAGLEIERVDSTGKPSVRYGYEGQPFSTTYNILDAQILSNGDMYLLIDDTYDISVLHFDSTGTLHQSVYLDGGYLRQDYGVQFIRLDSQIAVAMNTTNPQGVKEALIYRINWKHPVIPTKSVKRATPQSKTVALYPNPARDILMIDTDTEITDVRITDALGRAVNAPCSGNTLDVSSLTAGAYLISVTTSSGTTTQPFVISR